MPSKVAQSPMDELRGFLDSMGSGASAINPNNPLGQDAAPQANKANPMFNSVMPGAFNNPANPELNPTMPGSQTNPSNPAFNPSMPGATNNPSNPLFNPAMPGAQNNPSSPMLNPAMPGSVTNPSNPIHNPDYPAPDAIGQPPTNLPPNASFPPGRASMWRRAQWQEGHQCPVCNTPLMYQGFSGYSVRTPEGWERVGFQCPSCGHHLKTTAPMPLRSASDLFPGPRHQIWYNPGPRAIRDGQWGRGMVHVPSEVVYTWPEDEATHYTKTHALGLPSGEMARFDVHPSGAVLMRGNRTLLPLVTQADPRLQDGENPQPAAPLPRVADNATQDTREWPDPTEPRPSKPPMPQGCTCPKGHKLDCPVHGMNAEQRGDDHTWHLPEGWPIGYPQDAPRGWTDAIQATQ